MLNIKGKFIKGPNVVLNGLVFYLDAANPNSLLSNVEVLVVAGGGGGGAYAAGAGGGAGGVTYSANFAVTSTIAVTVGNGGGGGTYSPYSNPENGQNSSFGSIVAVGGGAGGQGWGANVGKNGGSGGGGAGYDGTSGTATVAGGSGTPGQGFAGGLGRGISANRGAAGGGGGAGGPGGDSTTNSSGNGGIGVQYSISGSPTWYGGGGGGGDYGSTNGGIGGTGGGGNVSGGNSSNIPAGNGVANTGGGGGGSRSATSDSWNGGRGGSGVVIVRYRGEAKASGGIITSVGGFTIHTFTSSGTFAPNWVDMTSNKYVGTLTNGPSISSSNSGGISFDGSNDFVLIGKKPALDIGGDITTEAWIKQTSTYANNPVVISNGYWSEVYPYKFQFEYNGGSSNLGLFRNDGSNYRYASWNFGSQNTFFLNRIVYVVATVSGSTWNIYYNGVAQSLTLSNTNPGNVSVNNTTNFAIAGQLNSAGVTLADVFPGIVYSARVYNRALSASEVLQNFNAMRGRFGI